MDYGEINRLMAERRAAMDKAKKRHLPANHLDSDFSDTKDKIDHAGSLIATLVALQPDDVAAAKALASDYFEDIPQDREAFVRNLQALLDG